VFTANIEVSQPTAYCNFNGSANPAITIIGTFSVNVKIPFEGPNRDRDMAPRLDLEPKDLWGLAGLPEDIDWNATTRIQVTANTQPPGFKKINKFLPMPTVQSS
jgi:hypothetical protein